MPSHPAIADVELRFRPRGPGRCFGAAFLCVWLCAWAAGEVFALAVIGHGTYSLVTGRPAFNSDQPVRLGPAIAVGCFLLVWLTIWTIGGVMAIRELLRSVWAEDRLVLDPDVLVRSHQLGPFRFTRRLARTEIRRVFVQPATTALMAQLGANVIELTSLGTPVDRAAAADTLRVALGLADEDAAAGPAALPEDWQEAAGPRGERLLVPNLQTRRKQALVVACVTSIVWTGLVLLVREGLHEPGLWAVILMLTALAAWLTRQTLWLFRGRHEWRIERGRLIHQRRFADDVTELAEARALELTESTDSDGDRWYRLNAVELSPPAFARAGKLPKQLKMARSIHDATAPRCLGRWLSVQAGIPLHDRVPTEADKQAEMARLKEQLANSGKFGRFIVRLLARARRSRDQR